MLWIFRSHFPFVTSTSTFFFCVRPVEDFCFKHSFCWSQNSNTTSFVTATSSLVLSVFPHFPGGAKNLFTARPAWPPISTVVKWHNKFATCNFQLSQVSWLWQETLKDFPRPRIRKLNFLGLHNSLHFSFQLPKVVCSCPKFLFR